MTHSILTSFAGHHQVSHSAGFQLPEANLDFNHLMECQAACRQAKLGSEYVTAIKSKNHGDFREARKLEK